MTELVELKGGLIVRVDALTLALDLEARGHALSVKDGALVVSHGSKLTPADVKNIKRLKLHLQAIAGYVVPSELVP